jgi:hypothetical protein
MGPEIFHGVTCNGDNPNCTQCGLRIELACLRKEWESLKSTAIETSKTVKFEKLQQLFDTTLQPQFIPSDGGNETSRCYRLMAEIRHLKSN